MLIRYVLLLVDNATDLIYLLMCKKRSELSRRLRQPINTSNPIMSPALHADSDVSDALLNTVNSEDEQIDDDIGIRIVLRV